MMQDLTTSDRFVLKRGRLKRESVCALVVVLAACGFGFVDFLSHRIVRQPDYHKLLFTEVARQHVLLTGTPIIVRENERVLEMFEREFNRRNERLGIPAQPVGMPDNEVFGFSFAPGMIEQTGTELIKTPGSQLVRQPGLLTIYEDEPGTRPMVIWSYSKRESLLAVFLYQLLTPDHPLAVNPPRPDPRFKQHIDWSGVVSVHGSIPNVTIFPEHAFLVPLGDLKLENLGPESKDLPQLFVFQHALPLVLAPGHDPASASVPNAGETIMLLRKQAARLFILTRRVFRWGVLPLGLLWLGTSFWRLRRLHRSFSGQLEELTPTEVPRHQISFATFLTLDLEAEMTAASKAAHSIQAQALAAERARVEINELRQELQRYVLENPPSPDEMAQIDHALDSESLPELRSLTDYFRRKKEMDEQIAREQQREIQWLVGEFEAVPPLKRRNEARAAWELYELALSCDEVKEKIHWLKEARKKLPRELRESKDGGSLSKLTTT